VIEACAAYIEDKMSLTIIDICSLPKYMKSCEAFLGGDGALLGNDTIPVIILYLYH
jgi:hypothetical protein